MEEMKALMTVENISKLVVEENYLMPSPNKASTCWRQYYGENGCFV